MAALALTTTPLISIGLPVFNASRHLKAAIEAHLAQTFPDFELVISDNGSTDDTVDICLAYARRDPRIRLHRSLLNRGLNWNHRQVYLLSKGPYFRWAAADDLPDNNFLACALHNLEQHPDALAIFPRAQNIDVDGTFLPTPLDTLDLSSHDPIDRIRSVLLGTYQMTYLQGLFRRSALAALPMRWNYIGYDFILLFELAIRGRCLRSDRLVLYRRLHADQATRALHTRQTMATFEPAASPYAVPHFVWAVARIRAVLRSSLPLPARLAALALTLRHAWWHKHLMCRDLYRTVASALRLTNDTPYRL